MTSTTCIGTSNPDYNQWLQPLVLVLQTGTTTNDYNQLQPPTTTTCIGTSNIDYNHWLQPLVLQTTTNHYNHWLQPLLLALQTYTTTNFDYNHSLSHFKLALQSLQNRGLTNFSPGFSEYFAICRLTIEATAFKLWDYNLCICPYNLFFLVLRSPFIYIVVYCSCSVVVGL